MPTQITKSILTGQRLRLCLMTLAAPVALNACTPGMGPGPMPTGYTYHNGTFNAPPGAEAKPPKGHYPAAQGTVTTDTTMTTSMSGGSGSGMDGAGAVTPDQAYVNAADDLITRIETNFGRLAEPVFIRLPANGNMSEAQMAGALDSVLVRRGYNVAQILGDGPFSLDYLIGTGQFAEPGRSMVTLTAYSLREQVAQESGIYTLPGAMPSGPAMGSPMGLSSSGSLVGSSMGAASVAPAYGAPDSAAAAAPMTPPLAPMSSMSTPMTTLDAPPPPAATPMPAAQPTMSPASAEPPPPVIAPGPASSYTPPAAPAGSTSEYYYGGSQYRATTAYQERMSGQSGEVSRPVNE